MHKWLKRGALAMLATLAVIALGVFALLRGSLPLLDGNQRLPGLSAEVSVARDANGTVTIQAANETDAMRALGYIHAQERYFGMDLMRRMADGELSALFGKIALKLDRQHRMHRLRERVRRNLADISGAQRAQLQAYVEGVNTGLASLRVMPWPYLLLRKKPQPWRMEDSALAAMAMYFDLQGGDNQSELALWRMQAQLPPALWALLSHDGSRWDAPLVGQARGDAHLPGPEQVDLRTLPTDSRTPATLAALQEPGSNNFAVAGSLTADGRAIVADDMHLTLRAPNIWFRARLRYPDSRAADGLVDVQGFTLPGLPAIVVGSNGHVAWGFTNSYIDTLDWKLQTPCTTGVVQNCAAIRRYRERIDVAGAAPVWMTVEETDWGPIFEHLPDHRVLALRWAAHLPEAVNLGLAGLAHARDLDDALRIADHIAIPTQNLMLGDAKGQIAWRLTGPIPQRAPGCKNIGTVIDTAHTDCPPWPLTISGNPLIRSPQATRLWTANTRVLDGEALHRVGDGGYSLGARAAQIRDALQARQSFTEHDLLQIQLDDRALFLAPWHRLLQERAQAAQTPALQALAAAAAQWDAHASVDSVSYRLVRDWRLQVKARVLDGLTAPARAKLGKAFVMPHLPQLEGALWPLVNQRPAHLLSPAFSSWDALFEAAAAAVRESLAGQGPLSKRTWGERNTTAICHPLAKAIPAFGKRWLCMPAQPLPGDRDMPRVQGPAFGASERMVVSPGHEADGFIHMPGGQSGHPLSPFWGAGHQDWATGAASPFLPGPALHHLRLTPGHR